jgi:hypothetical protein
MTKWEYKTVLRTRLPFNKIATDWDVDITKQLAELGDQGWELVAIEARCDRAYSIDGRVEFGATSNDVWVFKRPKG